MHCIISLLSNCFCNYACELPNMDLICYTDVSHLDSVTVNLKLSVLISGLEFKITMILFIFYHITWDVCGFIVFCVYGIISGRLFLQHRAV